MQGGIIQGNILMVMFHAFIRYYCKNTKKQREKKENTYSPPRGFLVSRVDVFNFVLEMDRAFREESQLHKKPSYSKPKGVSLPKAALLFRC